MSKSVHLVLALLVLTWASGLLVSFGLAWGRTKGPREIGADERYGPLRAWLTGVDVAEFVCDRPADESALRFFKAQYALEPTILSNCSRAPELASALGNGGFLVCDYSDSRALAELLQAHRLKMIHSTAEGQVVLVRGGTD